MFRLAVAVIEGEESRIRETFWGEVEQRRDEKREREKSGTKEEKRQSRGLWTAGHRERAKTLGHQNRETLGL